MEKNKRKRGVHGTQKKTVELVDSGELSGLDAFI
jgi:hypothetical protein